MGDHNRLKDSGFASIGEILDAIGVEDSSQAAVGQAVEADLGSVLQQLQTGPVQPTPQEKLGSTVGTQTATFGTNEQLEQEKQTLIDLIRQAGGNVGPAITEGIADVGNLVFQAVTLGIDPEPLYAVIPNIMDIIRGGIGARFVLGPSGNQQNTVIGTGQTGLGRGTKVAVGGIFGTIANIFKQGGNLGTVIARFPTILIDNLPGVIAAAASAGYAFTDDDKTTAVKMGLEPSVLDAIDDNKTVVAGGDDTATVKTGSTNLEDLGAGGPDTSILEDQTTTVRTGSTNLEDLGAGGPDTSILDNQIKTTEPEAIVFTPTDQQYDTTKTAPTLVTTLGEQQNQTRTPAELLGTLAYESTETVKTPAQLAAMLGYEAAETVNTPANLIAMLESEQVRSATTPAEIAAILGSENTQTIRSSDAPTLTTTLGGSSSPSASSGGLDYTTGARTVAVEPGPLVDIPGFYDISSRSIIPDYIDELIERNRERNLRRT
jgi:hypothetical protein